MTRVLVECRSMFPRESAGIETFVYWLLKGLSENPEISITINIPPGTRTRYEDILKGLPIEYLEDSFQARIVALKNRHKSVRYLLGVLRRLLPSAAAGLEGPRKRWSRVCEAHQDVILYPFQRDRITHKTRPVIFVMHDFFDFEFEAKSNRYRQSETYSLKKASVVVCCWPYPYKRLTQLFPEAISKTALIPFLPLDQSSTTIDVNCLEPYLLYCASTALHKNHDNLIKAVGLLKRRGFDYLRVVCTGPTDSARMETLLALVKKEGVANLVEFKGFVDREEISSLYARCFGVISPSKYEAFSGTILEGLAMGKPVACSDIEPLTELINLLNARVALFDPDSPESIALSIEDLFRNRDHHESEAKKARTALLKLLELSPPTLYWEIVQWIAGNADKPEWFPSKSIHSLS